jgi:chromosome segregation ATPase
MLVLLREYQEKEEQQALAFESEVIQLSSKIKAVTEKYQSSVGKYESLKEQSAQSEEGLKKEIYYLRQQMESIGEASHSNVALLDDSKRIQESLESKLQSKEQEIVNLNQALNTERAHMVEVEDEFHRKKTLLESALKEIKDRSVLLEQEKDLLRSDLESVEKSLAEAQTTVTKTTSKLVESAEDIRALRLELDATQKSALTEMETIRVNADKANREIVHLNALLDKAESEIEHHQKNTESIQRKSSMDYSELYQEKMEALATITQLTQSLQHHSSEVDALQIQLSNLSLQEKTLEKTYRELDNEKNLLHAQLTESIDMYANESMHANKLKLDIGNYEDKLSHAEHRIAQLMDSLTSYSSRIKVKLLYTLHYTTLTYLLNIHSPYHYYNY